MSFEMVHAGFDGFEIAFMGALKREHVEILEEGKATAQETHAKGGALVDLGSVKMHVGETGARGGYSYVCDTGPEGETWFFKKSEKKDGWNIRVSCKSLPLALFGIHETYQKIKNTLENLGVDVQEESLGRVDYAIDFLAPDFELNPAQFVAHYNCTRPVRRANDEGFTEVWARGRVQSVTVGKMPGRQVIVYNKRDEVITKQKIEWWHIWGLDRENKDNQVWRVELRAGKKHVKEKWGLKTFQDLQDSIGDIFLAALQSVRYLAKENVKNVTRAQVHELWEKCFEIVKECLEENRAGLLPDSPRTAKKSQITAQYNSLIAGIAASFSVVHNVPHTEIEDVAKRVHDVILSTISHDRDLFLKKVKKAEDRFHFVGELYLNGTSFDAGKTGENSTGSAIISEAEGSREASGDVNQSVGAT